MGFFGGGKTPAPPLPPPPPASPPTYASSLFAPPSTNQGATAFGGLSSAIQTSPFGVLDTRATVRKSLFGQ